jgi:membrane-associated protease RseP (regulator of RpoE activity)
MEAAGKEDSLRGSVEHGAAVTAAAGEPEPSAGRDVETPGHLARWEDLRSQLERLQSRIGGIERRLSAVSAVASSRDADQGRARTPEDRRAALRSAGVADDVAEEIVWLQGQEELDRLELRDQALREGWFGTDRYRAELSEISAQGPDLRADLGDDVYDRYLFAAGEDNRILVEGVIAGSVAEEIGLQPGDIIERYDGGRVFTFGELRRATSEGTRGELVDVQIRRADGSVVQSWVPRGPLGVRLDLTRAEPMP